MQNTDPLIGQQIDDYLIEDLLGHGGMGRVYRAMDVKLNRYVALKIMSQPSNKEKIYEKRFYREAQAIAKLKHPSIVAIYRFNEVQDMYYMAMEYVDGADLRWVLRDYAGNGELIDYKTLLDIMDQISKALDFAHKNGVIHRDIKPSNIMISRTGDAILTDFGLALDVQEGTGGEIFGSPHYIAPEQAVSSAQAVNQTDFYSLAVILFEMLTGSVPFDEGSAVQIAMAHIGDPLPDPKLINPGLHPTFIPVLQKALEKQPKDRYKNGATFIKALETAIARAEKDSSVPEMSTLGRPKDRIEKLTPLPQPIRSTMTKPATKMVRLADAHEPPTMILHEDEIVPNPKPDEKSESRQEKRRSSIPVLLLMIALVFLLTSLLAVAYVVPPEDRAEFFQSIPRNIAIGNNANPDVNAYVEGQVTDLQINNGDFIILTINNVIVQIDDSHPLYDSVELYDDVRIEGHFSRDGKVMRFDYVEVASLNGERIETEDTE